MSNDLGLPWNLRIGLTDRYLLPVVNSQGLRVAEFYRNDWRDLIAEHTGIDPAKLQAVFEAIRAMSVSHWHCTPDCEDILTAARAAGIIGSEP